MENQGATVTFWRLLCILHTIQHHEVRICVPDGDPFRGSAGGCGSCQHANFGWLILLMTPVTCELGLQGPEAICFLARLSQGLCKEVLALRATQFRICMGQSCISKPSTSQLPKCHWHARHDTAELAQLHLLGAACIPTTVAFIQSFTRLPSLEKQRIPCERSQRAGKNPGPCACLPSPTAAFSLCLPLKKRCDC